MPLELAWPGRPALGLGGPARPVKDSLSQWTEQGLRGQKAGSTRGPRDPGQSRHFSESEFPDVRRRDNNIYHAFLARPRKREDMAVL